MLILSHACRFGYLSQYLPIFGTVLWSNEFVSAKVRMIIDSKSMSARPTKRCIICNELCRKYMALITSKAFITVNTSVSSVWKIVKMFNMSVIS